MSIIRKPSAKSAARARPGAVAEAYGQLYEEVARHVEAPADDPFGCLCDGCMGDAFERVAAERDRYRAAIETHRRKRGSFAVWKGDRELWEALDG